MFIISNLVSALANILDIALTILYWLILIRALISWVNPDPFNPIVQFLNRTTEPFLYPIRRFMPAYYTGFDLSPIIAFLIIIFVKGFLVRTLMEFAVTLR